MNNEYLKICPIPGRYICHKYFVSFDDVYQGKRFFNIVRFDNVII